MKQLRDYAEKEMKKLDGYLKKTKKRSCSFECRYKSMGKWRFEHKNEGGGKLKTKSLKLKAILKI